MDIEHIDQPRHQGPGLLRIPAPIVPPRLLRPKHARKHAESQKCCTYIYKCIRRRQNILCTREQSGHSKDECTTKQGIRKHVHGDMRNEPRTLQRRHQRLVMNLGTRHVQNDKHRSQHRREGQDPSISPFEIRQQTGQEGEERIPQPRLPHRPHRRTLQRYPQAEDERGQHRQGSEGQAKGNRTTSAIFQRRG